MTGAPYCSDADPDTPAALLRLCPAYAPTPLLDLPAVAERLRVAAVLAKDESARPLGSFKSLGGVYGAVRALARVSGEAVAEVLDPARRVARPRLVCASDGNHGLAVAAAARLAGTSAVVFLPADASEARADRLRAKGARVERVAGTYDAAVLAAAALAQDGSAVLVADTGREADDPVLRDVMAGYGVIAAEIRAQRPPRPPPTHLFVQAGVGGLAAALAAGLQPGMAAPARVVVVEPAAAACVGAALAAGRPVPVPGSLRTSAEMLSCGLASAAVMAVLRRHGAAAMTVTEAALAAAPAALRDGGGPRTTPSGAAGFAGAVTAAADAALRNRLQLEPESRVLLVVTEGEVE